MATAPTIRDWLGTSDSSRPLPLVRDGDAVFFVGNSFFGFGDRPLPTWVFALGIAQSPPIHIETGSDIVFGNTPLAGFLRHEATQAALRSGKYRVFVLQAEEYEPVDHRDAFFQAVRDFNRAIVAAGAHTVLFMTWEFRWRPFIGELAASYEQIGQELAIPIIPVGLIFKDCGCLPLGKQSPHWLTASASEPKGALHRNAMGTAVNAFAIFELLTASYPKVTNFAAPNNTNNNDATMRYFAEMAWARVVPRIALRREGTSH